VQELMIYDIVWMSPQSHISLSVRPHFFRHMPQWPVLSGKSSVINILPSSKMKPGSRIVGSFTSEQFISDHRSRLPVFTPPTWKFYHQSA